MAEAYVCPSELHLKRELGAARKARCLRDPETHSSRRSTVAYSGLMCGDDIELELVSALPSTGKVQLYNWVSPARKSSDGVGVQTEAESKDMLPDAAKCKTATRMRKSIRKPRRAPLPKRRTLKASARTNLFDPPSSAYETLNSEDDDDARCRTSPAEKGQLIRKKGHGSSPDSPLISGSGARSLRNAVKDESSYSVTPASASSIDRRLRRNFPARRDKDRGCGGWYSPSLSDTLRRTGSSILCGTRQTPTQKKKKNKSCRARGRNKFLSNPGEEDRLLIDSETTSDEASTNFEELDLEAVSRLDGSRWPERKIREDSDDGETPPPHHRSLCQKYRPRCFDEIIGQSIVVQSLRNACLKGRIAPAYLFHGPRGTGKSVTARIFAAALNCLAPAENRPCGFCRECVDFAAGNGSSGIRELDASEIFGIQGIRDLLKNTQSSASSRRKIFIIDESHALPSKIWPALIKFLEEPPVRAVFLLITVDPDALPRAVLSRCQKYLFPKIKDADAVRRLGILSSKEGLEVELHALSLIAANSDGSLRDAETTLEQLSLLGKKITASLVNDLVGFVSDEKLLDLLEMAMSSNTSETVRRCREVLDSGVDPMVLMSQLAGAIMDAIAGGSLSPFEVNRLQEALRILSDAEKQLRVSSERSTWFTAALLQLGCGRSPGVDRTSGCSRLSLPETSLRNFQFSPQADHLLHERPASDGGRVMVDGFAPGTRCTREKLDEIWRMCIEKCRSATLRQLLFAHGQLLSISEAQGAAEVSLGFDGESSRNRAEGYSSSIANSMETVLGRRVRVRIQCVPKAGLMFKAGSRNTQGRSKDDMDASMARDPRGSFGYSAGRRSADCGETRLSRRRNLDLGGEGAGNGGRRSGCREDDVMTREDLTRKKKISPSKNWEDELSREVASLEICSATHLGNRPQESTFSPTWLRHNILQDKGRGWWKSGGVCRGLLCWKQTPAGDGGKKEASNSGARCRRLLRPLRWGGPCLKPEKRGTD